MENIDISFHDGIFRKRKRDALIPKMSGHGMGI
jgi:hypothetical protein